MTLNHAGLGPRAAFVIRAIGRWDTRSGLTLCLDKQSLPNEANSAAPVDAFWFECSARYRNVRIVGVDAVSSIAVTRSVRILSVSKSPSFIP